jgi:hypothetical protein
MLLRTLIVALVLLSTATASAAEIVTPSFRVVVGERGQPLAAELAESAEALWAELADELSVTLPAPVEIRLAVGPAEYRRMLPAGVDLPDWTAGVAFPRQQLVVLLSSGKRGLGPAEVHRTLRHELAHLALMHAAGFQEIPRWFNEAFAMLHADEWSLDRAMLLMRGAAGGRLQPLEQLRRSWPSSGSAARLAYAQSIAFVAFLRAEVGDDALAQTVTGLRTGHDFDTAVQTATGLELAELERRWLADLRVTYAWIPLLTSSGTLWVAITVVFLLAYARRRRDKRARLAQMDAEDHPPPAPPNPPLTLVSPPADDEPTPSPELPELDHWQPDPDERPL